MCRKDDELTGSVAPRQRVGSPTGIGNRAWICWWLASLLLAAGCQKSAESNQRFQIEHELSPNPARVGVVTLTISVTDASKPVTHAVIHIEADMSHAGMSPVFAEAKEIQPGRYQSQLAFGMAGDWVILVHGTLPDGEKLEQQFDVRGVQPN
jgi:hypothetical protein